MYFGFQKYIFNTLHLFLNIPQYIWFELELNSPVLCIKVQNASITCVTVHEICSVFHEESYIIWSLLVVTGLGNAYQNHYDTIMFEIIQDPPWTTPAGFIIYTLRDITIAELQKKRRKKKLYHDLPLWQLVLCT